MKNQIALAFTVLGYALATPATGQILISAGAYTQNFDSLATSGTSNPWTDNSTLPGWYASKTLGGSAVATYRGESGSFNTGALYSFGVAGVSNVTDRALGSVASGTPGNFAYGVRFINDTGVTQTNILVSYTGEQWRNGGNTSPHSLAFSYRISNTAITDSDAANANTWTSFTALSFSSPITSTTAGALDGNASASRQSFVNVILTGVSVAPGQELFLRWFDLDDPGFDHGLAIDDLIVIFNGGVSNPPSAPGIVTQPQSQSVTAGDNVSFTVLASGSPAPSYQWKFQGNNLPGETNTMLSLNFVTTNQAGTYTVAITNTAGFTNSQPATLTVTAAVASSSFSVLTYNVRGNGAMDWSTNAAQVQAIARQLQYLQPDAITFNEIPWDLRYEMTNFVAAFLPGYQLAVSSGTDGSICSAIASRHPITRASKWLDGIDLRSFGYSNANNALDNFTRDLFEAEIAVPGFARPLHVYTTHLKATTSAMEYADNAAKRAAEATAITNFFATNLFVLYPYDPYVLAGDMNANDTNELAIQKLISLPTGLTLTNPKNPVTGSLNTYSTSTANPSSRLDYIFPNPLLFSNIKTSQVFRSSLVSPLPPGLNSSDSQVASDHYPVLMVFNNPYDKPFKLLSITRTNPTVTLQWESVFGQPYRVEASTNLGAWSTLASGLVATGTTHTYTTNLSDVTRFFRLYRTP